MAESDLGTLLRTLTIQRRDGVWTYVSIDPVSEVAASSKAIMTFHEGEGTTHIIEATDLTPKENRWVWLELAVYSDLQAVGFLAKVAETLTAANVPCNAVAAYHHDHVFVPESKAVIAIEALELLAKQS